MPEASQLRSASLVTKIRLDRLLVERECAETRQKAQALIMAGRVRVDGARVEKAGTLVDPASRVEIVGGPARYVGRGGLKLQAALEQLHWDVRSKLILDIGSSTGGFVDCLLQHGAERVIAVDVGTGQMDWRLRQDPRVRLLERTNARYLRWDQIGQTVDCITVDVSFISVTQILPALVQFCKPGTQLLVLVKPQFEVGKGQVGRGGIVRDAGQQRETVAKVRRSMEALGFAECQEFPCPVPGASGNREFFLAAVFPWGKPAANSLVTSEELSDGGETELHGHSLYRHHLQAAQAGVGAHYSRFAVLVKEKGNTSHPGSGNGQQSQCRPAIVLGRCRLRAQRTG